MGSTGRDVLDRFRLDGGVALVTGAGAGIGKAYARALGQAGARLALVDVSRPAAEATAQELTREGVEAIALQADVSDSDQVDAAVRQVVQHYGALTVGVNNAGIGQWVDAEACSNEAWRRVMAVNLDSVFYCARAEAGPMLRAGYGKIVNTASIAAQIVCYPQNQVPYNASKAGVVHLTRTLAAEWAPRGIRVNCISPGYTRTALVDDLLATPIGKRMLPVWLERTPMARLGTVEDLQGAVLYLASPASDFVTGHDLVVDGGFCCW